MGDYTETPFDHGIAVQHTGVATGTQGPSRTGGLLLSGLRSKAKEGAASPPYLRSEERPDAPAPVRSVPQLPQAHDVPDSTAGEPVVQGVASAVEDSTVVTQGGPTVENIIGLQRYFIHQDQYFALNTEKGWAFIDQPIKTQNISNHLSGLQTMGVYPIADDGTVKWVAWDIDTDDSGDLYALLGELEPPYLVETTGNRGWHVWQFFSAPETAAYAFSYAQYKAKLAGLKCECFPKQTVIGDGRPGQSLLRLPFGVHRKTGRRSKIEFGTFGYIKPTGALNLPAEPETKGEVQTGWIGALFSGDVPEGRNNALNRLRWWLERRDFPPDVVLQVVSMANDVQSPPLDDDELGKVLRTR